MISANPQSHSQKALLSERINKLANALSEGVYEREIPIKLCLLAALSGESVFLLGPPGIAKSLIAKRLIQAFEQSSYFEYLMTRFSTPEEVFGPLSIQELKDNGKYVRLTEGYLPTSQVVFLDEIWKAGPAILNTLLTVVNEKTFKNGSEQQQVPMRLLVSASNELPDEDSGLEALYDRMLVRLFVNRIQNKQNFKSMLSVGTELEAQVPQELAISDDEYFTWLKELNSVPLTDELFEKLYQLKTMLELSASQHGELSEDECYVSDRRWKKSLRLLKASAFFNGRDSINPLDLLLLQDCLWNSPASREVVSQVIKDFALNYAFDQKLVAEKLAESQERLNDVQEKIENKFAITLVHESASGLLKKSGYAFDLSTTNKYKVGPTPNLVKLVLLQSNMSVSEIEKGDTRWIYVPENELAKVIQQGGGDVYGYVNQNTTLCKIHFDIDASEQLVVKDIANRSVLAAAVDKNIWDQTEFDQWLVEAQGALELVSQSEVSLRDAKASFHSALPHNFLDQDIPRVLENGIQALQSQLDSVKAECERVIQRFSQLPNYYQ